MQIVDADRIQWRGGARHRDDSIRFKDLFTGDPEQPGNYWFTLVRVEAYAAPTHRHNFDQIRYMLDGGFGFGDEIQDEGTIGYFTEGLPYTQKAIGPNVHLLLQCEGGNAARYLSREQVEGGVAELATQGGFAGGRYRPRDGSTDKDGFEAVWEHVTGDAVAYPEPRFRRPVIMNPEAFAWSPDSARPGVAWRRLGQFTERDLAVGFMRLDAGSTADIEAGATTRLFYVVDGAGRGEDGAADAEDARWAANSALRLAAGEATTLTADDDSTLFYVDLPR